MVAFTTNKKREGLRRVRPKRLAKDMEKAMTELQKQGLLPEGMGFQYGDLKPLRHSMTEEPLLVRTSNKFPSM